MPCQNPNGLYSPTNVMRYYDSNHYGGSISLQNGNNGYFTSSAVACYDFTTIHFTNNEYGFRGVLKDAQLGVNSGPGIKKIYYKDFVACGVPGDNFPAVTSQTNNINCATHTNCNSFDDWTKISSSSTKRLSYDDCMAVIGVKYCNKDKSDGWAGAMQACGGVNNVTSLDDLYELAKTIYGAENCDDSTKECTLSSGYIYCSSVPDNICSSNSSQFNLDLWTSQEGASNAVVSLHAYFQPSRFYHNYGDRGERRNVICK